MDEKEWKDGSRASIRKLICISGRDYDEWGSDNEDESEIDTSMAKKQQIGLL